MPGYDSARIVLGDVELDLRVRRHHRHARRDLILIATPIDRESGPSPNTCSGRDLRMRLLDNQDVTITVAEDDVFGDPVPDEKRGQLTAVSSDDTAVTVTPTGTPGEFTVSAVAGADSISASVLITDDVDGDGTGDFQGSIDFDLVDHRRGQVAQLVVEAGSPVTRPDLGGGDLPVAEPDVPSGPAVEEPGEEPTVR
jgi:hypothetical protein